MCLFSGCMSVSFTKTGKTYPPLAKDTNIDIIMRAVPEYKV